jgi:mRNA interferase RelE/StbE
VAKKPAEPARPAPQYQIEFSKPAEKRLAKLPTKTRRRIADKIDGLAQEPRPHGVEKLETEEDLYRIRVGDYRIIYSIEDRRLLVLVLDIGDRKDVYRGLRDR